MRAEVEHHFLLATTEDPRVGERRHTGADLDGTSTSIVQTTPLEEPPVHVPCPACNGAVYECSPYPDKNHHGDQTATFGNGSDDNGGGDGAELHL